MIIWQVDPWQPKFRRTWDYLMDWQMTSPSTAARAQARSPFGKPVVLVHGDTHVFRIDKGGLQADPAAGERHRTGRVWTDVPNFTRVETWAGGSFSARSPSRTPTCGSG